MTEVTNVGVNIAEKSTVIWNVADMLRGPFKPHEYGLVILPMTVIKRFNDCLMPTHPRQMPKVLYLSDENCLSRCHLSLNPSIFTPS